MEAVVSAAVDEVVSDADGVEVVVSASNVVEVVVSSADGSIAGLLGASPGASTGAHIMLEVLKKGFPTEFKTWEKSLKNMIPSFGTELNKVPSAAKVSLVSTAKSLKLSK